MPAGNFVEIAPISDYPEDNMRLNGGVYSPNELNSCLNKVPHRKQTDFSGSYSKSVLSFMDRIKEVLWRRCLWKTHLKPKSEEKL